MAEFHGFGEVLIAEFGRKRMGVSLTLFRFWQNFISLLSFYILAEFSLSFLSLSFLLLLFSLSSSPLLT